MALHTTKWDAADDINSAEDAALYLEAIFAEGEPALIPLALGDIARSKGMTEVARLTGISREGLYKALGEDGNPSWATVARVIAALGLRLEVKPVTKSAA